ncbi:MFS transporter [Erwinia sp.]|uniref:MFS transporter n=1 Tax=Erwinia citreus TaxID=558 RepID=UPI0028A21D37|nr:MFS transporter [Erwinia sp.]
MPLVTQTFNYKALMRIALVVAFVQFTNALEYMALTPVFAFMADDFSVPVSFSGYVSGMYTLGAVLSGVIAFYWIESFNKKQFLVRNTALLAVLTFCSTLITHFNTLLVLRFCAGLVGGTTMGVGLSMLINYAPENLRGKMLATVIASFPMVSIVGMPAILFLCTHSGWHAALWLISILCLLSLLLVVFILPGEPAQSGVKTALAINTETLFFASCTAVVQFSPMLIIPILTPLMTQYMGVEPGALSLLFLSGGVAGYLSTKMSGWLLSRLSALMLAIISTLLFIASLVIPAMGFHHSLLFITLFLGAAYSRLVAASSVAIRYPGDEQRAGFSSLQTAIMYLITTLAFFLSSLLLPDQRITTQNLHVLFFISALTAAGFPVMVIILQRKLAKRTLQPDQLY